MAIAGFGGPEGHFSLAIIAFGAHELIVPSTIIEHTCPELSDPTEIPPPYRETGLAIAPRTAHAPLIKGVHFHPLNQGGGAKKHKTL